MSTQAEKILRFGTPAHDLVRDKLWARFCRSRDQMISERTDEWAKCEEQFRAYIPVQENDQMRKNLREQKGEPQYTTLEIPYSYATLLTAHTYITSTFFGRNPIVQLQGRHGEAENAVMAMEALIDYQIQQHHILPFYIWTLDALKYGLGVIGYHWDEERVKVRTRKQVPQTFMGLPIPGKLVVQDVEEDVLAYQGTKGFNVRPQDFFTDPSYPAGQFQKGEYCARYTQLSMMDMRDCQQADGSYFNLDALEQRRTDSTRLRVEGSSQIRLANDPRYTSLDPYNRDTGTIDGHEFIVRLVPREWGLGNSTRSEKWMFTLAEGEIIVSARPLGYYHNRFPFEVLESEIDGHSLYSRSTLEILKPMNDVLTWLLNTHFYNVRKSLNDQLVVDPSKVVMKDLTNPNPGRLIRLKPSAYGTDPRLAVSQLQVQDITRANLTDAQLIMEMMQRVSGINDNLMGMFNSGRKTATEVRSSTTFGINRMKTMCEWMSAQGFSPYAQQLVQVTQQFYDQEKQFRIAGDAAQWMTSRFINVKPDDIAGFYDFVPVDGTLPVDRMAQVNLWNQIMSQASAMPQIMQGYDFVKIFAFVAQLAGLKNINQFRIQVVPDDQMAAQVAAGNSIPATGAPQDLAALQQNGGNVQPLQIPGQGQQL